MKFLLSLLVITTFLTSSFAQQPVSSCKAGNLRCEYLVNPIGVDARFPRLSWLINDRRYGALQKAYRLIIGTDSGAVASGGGDI